MGGTENIRAPQGRRFVELLRARWAAARQSERPCADCHAACPCARSTACTCSCAPACLDAPRRLVPGRLVSGAGLRLALDLATMRGVKLCAPPSDGRSRLQFRTEAAALPVLLAHELEALGQRHRVEGRWALRVLAHGPTEPAYVLEADEGSASAGAIEAEFALLGESLGPRLRAAIDEALREEAPAGASELSDRESEVLLAFLDGLAVQSMARRFHLSPHTVRNHLKTIFRKLGVHSQRELRELFSSGLLAAAG